MYADRSVIAVLPAYNAAKTLAQTVRDIDRRVVDEIILVDDCSQDETVALARRLGLRVIQHDRNRGYGGNQKTCYAEALKLGAEIVVMVHPDHQYNPRLIRDLVTPIALDQADAAFGSRMLTPGGARGGGMPWWKYIANIGLTKYGNAILGLRLSEYHSGFRAYSRAVLRTIPLEENSDDFVFDTEIIVQLLHYNFRITEIPIETRYFSEASSIGLRRSLTYGWSFVNVINQYLLVRTQLRRDARFVPIEYD